MRGHNAHDADRASAALGVVQEDAMRPITGSVGFLRVARDDVHATGAFLLGDPAGGHTLTDGAATTRSVFFNSALLGAHYAGSETRPANIAVRYLVKALE